MDGQSRAQEVLPSPGSLRQAVPACGPGGTWQRGPLLWDCSVHGPGLGLPRYTARVTQAHASSAMARELRAQDLPSQVSDVCANPPRFL